MLEFMKSPFLLSQGRPLRSVWFVLALLALASLQAADPGPIRHSFLALGGRTAIVDEQDQVSWEYRGGSRDGFVLPGGNVLVAFVDAVEEVTRDKRVVFRYGRDARNKEIGTTQRLANGRTLVTELGPVPRLLEIEPSGRIVVEVPLQPETDNAHMQTRMARQLPNGHFLVPHLLAFAIKEYAPDGKIVATLRTDLPALGGRAAENWPFTAIRLANAHTLVSLTHGNKVVEFDAEGGIAWRIDNPDVGGVFNDPCGSQRLANGNTVIGSHGASSGVSMIEVTPAKQIVWKTAHLAAAGVHHFQILSTNGRPEPAPPLK